MRLLRNPPSNTRLHRRLLLQGATPALRLRLSSKFLQRLHTDAVLKRGLICSMEEDPIKKKTSKPPSMSPSRQTIHNL